MRTFVQPSKAAQPVPRTDLTSLHSKPTPDHRASQPPQAHVRNAPPHDFSRIAVAGKAPLPIQPKLKVSMPGDREEQEADRVAEEVMRMAEPASRPPQPLVRPTGAATLQRACSCAAPSRPDDETLRRSPVLTAAEPGVVDRAINPADLADSRPVDEMATAVGKAEDEAQPGTVARQAATAQPPVATRAPDIGASIDGVCRGGGRPLPARARQFMEPRFGHDFSAVRIHADATADDLAQRIQARAFATGNHVFFARGEFQPERKEGKQLLAHELAHVVQQGKGGSGTQRRLQRSGNGALNCPPYASYDKSADLNKFNCAGLAHRSYDFKSLSATKAAVAGGSSLACGTACDRVGVVKHWLWEYDIHTEDSAGKVINPTWQDFHTVGGPTDGDPLPKDSDEFYTKNGKRKVYGPGTALSFKPAAKDRSLTNDPSETPMDAPDGGPLYKVRTNIAESCYCLPCPKAAAKTP